MTIRRVAGSGAVWTASGAKEQMTMEEALVGSHGSGGLATQDLRRLDQGAYASVRRGAG